MIAISITNCQKTLPVDRQRVRRAVRAILKDARVTEARISVAVVDDPTIAGLHQQFLNDPEPTDVLSFLLEQAPPALEGEVVVSADTARTCGPRHGCSADEELLRYVVHGTLHLAGYEDSTPKKRAAMQRREEEYLSQCRLKKPRPS